MEVTIDRAILPITMLLSVVLISFIFFHTGSSTDVDYDYEGEIASIGNYSYVGVLTIRRYGIFFRIFYEKTRCVSVLVSPEYAVTSAECASKSLIWGLTTRYLTYGCSNLEDPDCNTLRLRSLPKIHPDYRSRRNADFDISVFRIEKPVKDDRITFVKLPEFSENAPEGNGTLVFWALSGNDYLNNVLREVPVSVTKCNKHLASQTSFCVGNLKSACHVEKGSAFVIGEILYGVAKDCFADQISFTNVASTVKFVKKEADLK